VSRAHLPCCERVGSTVQFCIPCLVILSERSTSLDNITECPRCKKYIQVRNGDIINVDQAPIECAMCKQKRIASDSNASVCSACFSGMNSPLRYECSQCHRVQRIPHPMYRYQESTTVFSTASWACHQRCGDYTKWRIVTQDICNVPIEDAPEGWGLREQEFEAIRQIRRGERQVGGSFSSCSIM